MLTTDLAGETRRTRSPLYFPGARLPPGRRVAGLVLVCASVSCVGGYPIETGLDAGAAAVGMPSEGEAGPAPPADERGPMPERLVTIDFADPLLGYEANANVWYSLNQAFGRLNDGLGVGRSYDNTLAGRVLLGLTGLYLARGLTFYSHEVAHDYEDREHGLHSGFALDLGDWSSWYPRYVQSTGDWWTTLDDDEMFKNIVHGLNQNEFDSAELWKRGTAYGVTDMHDALAYLTGKLDDLGYVLGIDLEDKRPPFTGVPAGDVLSYTLAWGSLWNDIDQYTLLLYNKGIDLRKRDYLAQVLVADLLSWHTWESMGAVWRYLRTGERVSEPARWRTSGGLEITPPLISCYLTPLGTFYDMKSFLNPRGAHPVMISIGTDVDSIGDGEVDRFRLGAQYHNLTLGRLRLGPFAYVNTSRAKGYEGASIGAEGFVRLTPRVELTFTLEHNEGDVIENVVKGKDEGFGAKAGIDVRF